MFARPTRTVRCVVLGCAPTPTPSSFPPRSVSTTDIVAAIVHQPPTPVHARVSRTPLAAAPTCGRAVNNDGFLARQRGGSGRGSSRRDGRRRRIADWWTDRSRRSGRRRRDRRSNPNRKVRDRIVAFVGHPDLGTIRGDREWNVDAIAGPIKHLDKCTGGRQQLGHRTHETPGVVAIRVVGDPNVGPVRGDPVGGQTRSSGPKSPGQGARRSAQLGHRASVFATQT